MRFFYSVWVDCIIRTRSIEANKNDWKTKSLFYMSEAMTFNFVLIMVVFQGDVLGFYFYEINLPFLSGFANYIIPMSLLYALPCFIMNYLLIFRNNRYEKLLKKYKYHNGKLILKYYIVIFFLPVVLFWIGFFWGQIKF